MSEPRVKDPALRVNERVLRVNGTVEESIVDGPGLRFVIFTQGCRHHCPGCHNPDTHNPDGGSLMDVETILGRFTRNPLLSGITFSGGEPFEQPVPLCAIAERVGALGKTVMIYTGYTLEQLRDRAGTEPAVKRLLLAADILVDGLYVEALRDLELPFRGSANQRVLTRQDILQALGSV